MSRKTNDQREGVGRQNWARGHSDLPHSSSVCVLVVDNVDREVGKINLYLRDKDRLQVVRMLRQLLVGKAIQQRISRVAVNVSEGVDRAFCVTTRLVIGYLGE